MKKLTLLSLFFIINCQLLIINCNAQSVLQFGGTNAYVTFGIAPQLGLPEFTLECWFNKQGAGVTASTGTGGVVALPLIAKGRGEADGTTQDMNYFLGINASNQLCADFEEITPSANPGLNHPIVGITTIADNIWYHASATYDGAVWKLYLNGVLENTVAAGVMPQSGSIQHASIGSALNSTGAPSGYFYGMISEARIWDTALTSYEILANINIQLTYPLPHLVSHWAMDEGSGTNIYSGGSAVSTGTIIGNNYTWVNTTVPFDINLLPDSPVVVNPANSDSCQSTSVTLSVNATDQDNTSLIVNFYGRPRIPAPPPFTIIGLPDTQHYCALLNGGTNQMYKAQTNWIVANRTALNIPFVAHFGDCVQNGDNGGNDIEWKRCDTAMSIIENPVTTTLADGIPYAMNVGNHDQSPVGSATGTSTFYNQYFGVNRFSARPWSMSLS